MKQRKTDKQQTKKRNKKEQGFTKSSKDLEKEAGIKSEFGNKKKAPPEEPRP